jgi:pyruvate/2-oxoglutarate dehydrogenase complex dihydrolipoamide dehydrogenase (E3) component
LLETSLPGVFAIGDVRGGSIKRVASAVGEGSIAIESGIRRRISPDNNPIINKDLELRITNAVQCHICKIL